MYRGTRIVLGRVTAVGALIYRRHCGPKTRLGTGSEEAGSTESSFCYLAWVEKISAAGLAIVVGQRAGWASKVLSDETGAPAHYALRHTPAAMVDKTYLVRLKPPSRHSARCRIGRVYMSATPRGRTSWNLPVVPCCLFRPLAFCAFPVPAPPKHIPFPHRPREALIGVKPGRSVFVGKSGSFFLSHVGLHFGRARWMSDQGEPIGQEREQKQCACLVFRLTSNCRRSTFEAYHLPVLHVGFPPPLDLGQRSGARKGSVRAPNAGRVRSLWVASTVDPFAKPTAKVERTRSRSSPGR
jgi:hypothetical protein